MAGRKIGEIGLRRVGVAAALPCSLCGQTKPVDQFPIRRNRGTYETWCRTCSSARARTRRLARGPEQRICSVHGCDQPVRQTGLCNAHYLRQYRHGSVGDWTQPDLLDDAKACKTCSRCQKTQLIEEFARRWGKRCRACRQEIKRREYAANPEPAKARTRAYYAANVDARCAKARANNMRRKYGITPEHYHDLLMAQSGKCAICSETEPGMAHMLVPLVVDHDHETDEIRGLLCVRCNAGLGQFADDPDRLISAAAYLLTRVNVLGSIG